MFVYILFSPVADVFYTGFTTESVENRLQRHLSGYYDEQKFTGKFKDWEVFISIQCSSTNQARSIEKHIKGMKSKVYIRDIKKYPEIIK